jgi:hypothetical protein
MYCFGDDEGRPGPPAELQCEVLSRAARDPVLKARMALVMEHQRSPYEAFPVSTILRWTLGAAARGKLRVVREFLEMGKRAAGVNRELAARRESLAAGERPDVRSRLRRPEGIGPPARASAPASA